MTRRWHVLGQVALLGAALSCGDQGQLPSPTVRVDLSHSMPRKEQRRLQLADTTYECSRPQTVSGGGARQSFVVTWRVFQGQQGRRYITAVQVAPDGPFVGGRGPVASAVVRGAEGKGTPGKGEVSVEIRWTATHGCSSIQATGQLALRPDDPDCKPPKSGGGKIFTK